MAVLEALYQGRYKVISVEEILKLWHRRGQPTFHFTHDFERLVCKNLPGKGGESEWLTVTQIRESIKGSSESSHDSWEDEREMVDLGKGSSKGKNASLSLGDRSLFNDPREVMSNVEELFSHLTVATPTASQPREITNGNGSNESSYQHSIHEFIPLLDGSALYSKLKAVARSVHSDR
jgi:hypothetical protein